MEPTVYDIVFQSLDAVFDVFTKHWVWVTILMLFWIVIVAIKNGIKEIKIF